MIQTLLQPRIIPILLMRGSGLYKGVKFDKHKYVGDPMNAVRIFNDKRVDELLFIDILATKENRIPDLDFLRKVSDETYMPFGVGGGLKSIEDIRKVLKTGAEKISINSAAAQDPDLIRAASEVFGKQSVTVSIDVKKNIFGDYVVKTCCGTKKTKLKPVEFAQEAEALGAGEILITSIDSDGTGQGYDLTLVKSITEAVNVPVIACGGAGKYEDLAEVVSKVGASAAAAGSLFVFHGKLRAVLINYPDLEWRISNFDSLYPK